MSTMVLNSAGGRGRINKILDAAGMHRNLGAKRSLSKAIFCSVL